MSNRSLVMPFFLGLVMMLTLSADAVGPHHSDAGSGIRNKQTDAPEQLQLVRLHILFKGQPVDQLITGTKAKRYTIELTGSGFDPSSRVFIDEQKVPTTFMSATELTAKLRGSLTSAPGELDVKVMNPDGQISNALTVDVISNPADLSIISLSSDFGMSGAQITVTGLGFTPTGNSLRFRRTAQPGLTGLTPAFPSAGGGTITFDVPLTLCPPCFFTTPPCLPPAFR